MGWTTIDGDTSWQELAIAQEIATAYNKRVAALSSNQQSAAEVSEITPAETMTVFDFVLAVQTGIEAMARYWGDKNRTLIGIEPPSSLTLFTNFASVSEMMTAAGLTASGYWRRIGEGGTQPDGWTAYTAPGWSYGKITDKDLAGPWLFIDLQAALSALTRRFSSSVFGQGGSTRYYSAEFSVYLDSSQPPSAGSFELKEQIAAVDGYGVYKYSENTTSNPVDPSVCNWQMWLDTGYRDHTVSPMSEEIKTVTLYGYYNWYRGAYYNGTITPSWTPGLGIGLGTLSEGDNPVVALDSYTGADTSATLRSNPALSSWSIESYVPWLATAYDTAQTTSAESIYVNILGVVVDYAFDP